MNIALIPWRYDLSSGGVENCMSHLHRELGNKVTYICLITSVSVSENYPNLDILTEEYRLYRVKFPIALFFAQKGDRHTRIRFCEVFSLPWALIKIWAIIKKNNIDIINIHYVGPNALCVLLLSYFCKLRIVVTLHGMSMQNLRFYPSRLRLWVFRNILKKACHITAVSKSLIEDATKYVYPNAVTGIIKKSSVIPNGVDVDEFKNKEGYNLPSPYMLSHSSFDNSAFFNLLIMAFSLLIERGCDLDLVISGKPSVMGKAGRLICLLGLQKRVFLSGIEEGEKLDVLVENSTLCILPSPAASFSRFVIKAMAYAKPLVAIQEGSDNYISRDYFDVISANTPEALAEALKKFIENNKPGSKLLKNNNNRGVFLDRFKGLDILNVTRTIYIFSIGAFWEYKGFDLLIKAFKLVIERGYEIKLILSGDGEEKESCRRLAKELKLEDKIIFWGYANRLEVSNLFAKCEFFVLPSRVEPFGIVSLEAMAAGKAIVATNVDGVPEIVRNGENGILVEPDDEYALAFGIIWLLENREMREKLGANGRELVRRLYKWDDIARRYLEVYQGLI